MASINIPKVSLIQGDILKKQGRFFINDYLIKNRKTIDSLFTGYVKRLNEIKNDYKEDDFNKALYNLKNETNDDIPYINKIIKRVRKMQYKLLIAKIKNLSFNNILINISLRIQEQIYESYKINFIYDNNSIMIHKFFSFNMLQDWILKLVNNYDFEKVKIIKINNGFASQKEFQFAYYIKSCIGKFISNIFKAFEKSNKNNIIKKIINIDEGFIATQDNLKDDSLINLFEDINTYADVYNNHLLSNKEKFICIAFCKGYNDKEIYSMLGVSKMTFHRYKTKLRTKLKF